MLICSALQNGTGFLSRCELAQMLRENGVALSPDQLNTMFAKLDAVRIYFVYTFKAIVNNTLCFKSIGLIIFNMIQ